MGSNTYQDPPEAFSAVRQKVENHVRSEGREKFMQDARISVPTIAAIRSGRFPWLESGKPVDGRRLAKWARTFTRVARLFNEPPDDWCKAAGLEVTPAISEAIKKETERLAQSGEAVKPVQRREVDILRRIAVKANDDHTPKDDAGRKKVVVAGLLDYPPFSTADSSSKSFFFEIADRIVGTINPDWGIETDWRSTREKLPGQISDLVEGLADENPVCDFAVGLFDTIYRRFRGIDFVPIPGWRIQLSALWFSQTETSDSPKWRDIVSPIASTRYTAVVIDGEAGHLYLDGPCRYDTTHLWKIKKTNIKDYDAIADAINLQAKKAANVVFVADEETCLRVLEKLNAPNRQSERCGSTAKELTDPATTFPRYPLALAFKHGDPHWRELLVSSVENELFRNAVTITAALYAGTMTRGVFDSLPSDRPRSTWQPEFFKLQTASETEEFWDSVFRALLISVKKRLLSSQDFPRSFPTAAWQGHLPSLLSAADPAKDDLGKLVTDIAWWTMPEDLRLAAIDESPQRREKVHLRIATKISEEYGEPKTLTKHEEDCKKKYEKSTKA